MGLSIWHWLILAAIAAVFLVPGAKILKRMGFSGWWVLVAIIPFGGLVGLWVLSSIRWPSVDKPSA